jgi:hypothetical protein
MTVRSRHQSQASSASLIFGSVSRPPPSTPGRHRRAGGSPLGTIRQRALPLRQHKADRHLSSPASRTRAPRTPRRRQADGLVDEILFIRCPHGVRLAGGVREYHHAMFGSSRTHGTALALPQIDRASSSHGFGPPASQLQGRPHDQQEDPPGPSGCPSRWRPIMAAGFGSRIIG